MVKQIISGTHARSIHPYKNQKPLKTVWSDCNLLIPKLKRKGQPKLSKMLTDRRTDIINP